MRIPGKKGERPDLAGKAIVPDVPVQAHSASLEMCFYTAKSGAAVFPADYIGRCLCGVSRLVEPQQPDGLQGRAGAFMTACRLANTRIFSPASWWMTQRLGPAGRRGRGA